MQIRQDAAARTAVAFVVLSGIPLAAQAQHTPRGNATDITDAQIQAAVAKTASQAVSDQQMRVVPINGEYNIGVGVVRRVRVAGGKQTANGIEHSQITEIYHVISGSATLVTGGTIENVKDVAPTSAIVTTLNGPSSTGGAIDGGVSRKVVAGDVIVIPPNTAHWFSEITSPEILYLVIRVDPKNVLPAGYVLPDLKK